MNTFMGKEWEVRQLEILKAKQEKRIAELNRQATKEVTTAEVAKKKANDQLPPEQL